MGRESDAGVGKKEGANGEGSASGGCDTDSGKHGRVTVQEEHAGVVSTDSDVDKL